MNCDVYKPTPDTDNQDKTVQIEVPVYFYKGVPVCSKSLDESCMFKYTSEEFRPKCSVTYDKLSRTEHGLLKPHNQCPLHT